MPSWVAAILGSRVTSVMARVILTFMFWSSGLSKLLDFKSALGEMSHFHLAPPAPFAVATIAVELVGSILVIWGRWAWLGAGALGVFTALTIPLAHHYWDLTGPERLTEMYAAFEHVSVIGGLILAAMLARRDATRR